jgi:DNA-binding NarL/FixJ family response regulator
MSSMAKIVFLSQHDSPHVANEALRVGGNGYVAKIDASSKPQTAIRAAREGHFFVSQKVRRQGWKRERNWMARFETFRSQMEPLNL